MNTLGPWSTEDFEHMSWHDVHVHGFRFAAFDSQEGSADLVLDIDYILEWKPSGSGFQFTVCQALLRFHDVFDFRMNLDYKSPSAGMCPFSIGGIEREAIEAITGYKSFRWVLPINWPHGHLEFQAPSFTQSLLGSPRVQSGQFLSPSERQSATAA
jgi:hypothetical protein